MSDGLQKLKVKILFIPTMDPAILNFKFDGNLNSYHAKPQSGLSVRNFQSGKS